MPDSCPSLLELVRAPAGSSTAVHRAECDDCRKLVEVVEIVRASGNEITASPPTGSCLDAVLEAELIDGTVGPEDRRTALAHLCECGACRGRLASLAAALSDPQIARELRSLERGAGTGHGGVDRAVMRYGAVAAAALVAAIGVVLWRGSIGGGEMQHRGPVVTAGATPAAITPRLSASDTDVFRWRSVPGADRYELVVQDANGEIVTVIEVTDSTVPVAEVELTSGTVYFWKVRARVGFGRWSESDLVRFEYQGSDPP